MRARSPTSCWPRCGDVATMEALAAAAILRERMPDLKLRFVNVVDLFQLQPASEHPHGSTDREFDSLFTTDKPIIFNFHGYPWLIHRLAYRFKGHENLHVRGYKEKGNINTPLELAMLNETSRFHLVIDVIDRVPKLRTKAAHLKEEMKNAIIDNLRYAHEHGTDRPELANWTWPYWNRSVRLSIASAETVESRAAIDADVCVVGAGPAGLAIARQLGELGRTVLLLESGGLAVDQATADLNELADTGPPRHRSGPARDRRFGGSLWYGRLVTFDPIDFDARSWVPLSGWPIAREDIDTRIDAAADFLGLSLPRALSPEFWQHEPAARLFDAGGLAPRIHLIVRQKDLGSPAQDRHREQPPHHRAAPRHRCRHRRRARPRGW